MKSFDIFRKLRDDIDTSSWIGGLYTILAFIVAILPLVEVLIFFA
mgnify:CR=1 FL=1